ncbi:MAG: RluA family pseudouridine synthase [Erysipelothrix sp.]|nr:RluA family pseudouridine synthase [Erysipelothrix sp.]
MKKIIIDIEDENKRIDQYMTTLLKEYSRNLVQTWITDGKIKVNDSNVKSNYRLKEDDEVSYIIVEEDLTVQPIEMNLDVVYEDDDIMVVNKPKALIVHPSATTINQPTLVHGLLAHTDKLSDLNGELRPGIVHRLDKDTSGLLIVAKTNAAHEVLVDALKAREITREYMALAHHPFNHKDAIIDAPIGRDVNNRQRMSVTHVNSKEAKTKVTLVENIGDYSLLKCQLESGRTHQIRVHLSYIKHPIVGDNTYSYKNTLDTDGQMLHAYHLEFKHPITKELMSFTQDVPEVFNDTVETIRREA